ncbi:MAG TPA: CoA ester lyase [Steroidobacteraceae bacterium]
MSTAGVDDVAAVNASSAAARPAPLRSWLFVPGDSDRKQAKALASAADALILDLEDSVTPEALPAARIRVRELLRSQRDRARQQLWVRVNALGSGRLLEDLGASVPGAPDGIVLPKADSVQEVCQVAHYLEALEAREGSPIGSTRLLVIATESPRAVLSLGGYAQTLEAYPQIRQRLVALTWGCEDLSSAMGITHKTDRQGSLTFTFRLARSLCILTAAALKVQPVDGVYLDFRDIEGLRRDVESARRDGFTGKLAIHPEQIEPIHAALLPAAEEVHWAREVVAAFERAPHVGALSLNGQMLDRPHLAQARRILAAAEHDRKTKSLSY